MTNEEALEQHRAEQIMMLEESVKEAQRQAKEAEKQSAERAGLQSIAERERDRARSDLKEARARVVELENKYEPKSKTES